MSPGGVQVTGLRAWMSPSFALLIFLVLPAMVLLRPDTMLTDPGIGWHLKTGEYILDTGAIPTHDIFSFTRPEEPWIAHEWLFDVLAALLTRLGGLPLLSAVSALVYASLPVLLYRKMVRDGSAVALAATASIAACVLFAAHAHARPHIVTYLGFLLLGDRLARVDDGAPARSLGWFVPGTALWANLHGGFVLAPVLAGLYLAGTVIRYARSRRPSDLRKAWIYGALGAGTTAASLINPAGWNLHRMIFRYLSSESLSLMVEYQSPDFRNGSLAILLFGFLIVALVLVLGIAARPLGPTEALLLAFFLYQALTAVRHVFLFAILAIPILVRELTPWLGGGGGRLVAALDEAGSRQTSLRSDRIWFPTMTAVFLGLAVLTPSLFRTDLDGIHLSRGARQFLESHHDELGPMFNTSSLGGALVYGFWPTGRVFGDDRNDFYGDDFLIGEYFPVSSAGRGWETILSHYGVTSAILVRGEVMGEVLDVSPEWRRVYGDDLDEIFLRTP